MNRIFAKSAVLFAAMLAAFAAPQALFARTVTDHLDRTVKVPEKIERVAVADILPYPSVICVYLGSCNKIVAMHLASKIAAQKGLLAELFPEVLKADTSAMLGSDVNVEAILALKPDVIFVNAGNKRLIKRLETAGIAAVAVSTGKWGYDVMQTYTHWVDLLDRVMGGTPKSQAAAAKAREVEELIAARTANIAEKDRVKALYLVQYDARRIVTSGKLFFGQYWATAAGGVNAAGEVMLEKGSAVVDFEKILAWNPQAVFLTNFTDATPEDIYKSRFHDWSGVEAVKRGAVYKMPLALYRSYTPSADSPVTLLWTAKALYPDQFADIDVADFAVKFYKDVYGLEVSKKRAEEIFVKDQK